MNSTNEWPLRGNPDEQVGAPHHIVPRFQLEMWSNSAKEILVVQKTSGKRFRTHVTNAGAERDFYTYVGDDGELHGHAEQMLSKIEDQASSVIKNALGVFQVFPPQSEDRVLLATLIAFQMTRGRKTRRALELQADLMARLRLWNATPEQLLNSLADGGVEVDSGSLDATREFIENLDSFEFSVDPNVHIGSMGQNALGALPFLMRMRWYLFDYGQPSLLTCDEPVALYMHNPLPTDSLGLATADELWYPLSPRHLLVLTRHDVGAEGVLPGDPATLATVNYRLVQNAYEHIFMHPDHDVLPTEMPDDMPLFEVAGGPNAEMLTRYNRPPTNRKTERRRKRR
ncbi:DUF4238 domain-containing protein [Catellatospora sp. KI3]|nr:DUF4238 domain-containing protein [Catellatospora sp. KI3]MDI1463361.1 DUF4238 domain-containing protein [Catellatospora sp. KI3]